MAKASNIRPNDRVKLTVSYNALEPAINDGETILLPAGWERKFKRYTDNDKFAELEYVDGSDITIKVPVNIIEPA